MTVSLLLLAHDKPRQLGRLVHRLVGPHTRVHIHLDRRVDPADFQPHLPVGASLLPRSQSLPARWGGYNIVEACLRLLRLALQDETVERFATLSGADYPVVGYDAMVAGLMRPGQQLRIDRRLDPGGTADHDRFIRHYRAYDHPLLARREHPVLSRIGHLVLRAVPRRLPAGLDIYHGSAWCVLDRAGAEAVTGFAAGRPDVVDWFRHVAIPDEMLFHTILKNGPLAATISQDYAETPTADRSSRLFGVHFIDWSQSFNGGPPTLTLENLPAIRASGALFCRKVDPVRSATLLAELDRLA